MAYAMLDSNSGKYAVSSKKDFSQAAFMYLDDAERFFSKIKIVKPNSDIIQNIKAAQLTANSNIKDFRSKL